MMSVVMMVMFRLLHTIIIIIQGSIIFVWHKKFLPFLTDAVIKKSTSATSYITGDLH